MSVHFNCCIRLRGWICFGPWMACRGRWTQWQRRLVVQTGLRGWMIMASTGLDGGGMNAAAAGGRPSRPSLLKLVAEGVKTPEAELGVTTVDIMGSYHR
eukprot:SAG31_NODE_2596_length_5420_cov_45.220330_7_plen_99_part_00